MPATFHKSLMDISGYRYEAQNVCKSLSLMVSSRPVNCSFVTRIRISLPFISGILISTSTSTSSFLGCYPRCWSIPAFTPPELSVSGGSCGVAVTGATDSSADNPIPCTATNVFFFISDLPSFKLYTPAKSLSKALFKFIS